MSSMKLATAGRPALATDYGTNAAIGRFLKCIAGALPGSPLDTDWGDVTGGFPAPALSAQVFVSVLYGNDVTGDGTSTKPYRTINHALATITDASVAKPYILTLLSGEYVEDVALKPFVILQGINSGANATSLMNAAITGAMTLGPGFAGIDVELVWVSNCDINGTLTLDYTGSDAGKAYFTNCNLEDTVTVTSTTGNNTEFHHCEFFGAYTQVGGFAAWYDSNGNAPASALTLKPTDANPVLLECFGGSWQGTVALDQDGRAPACTLRLLGCSMSQASAFTVTASAAHCPAVLTDYGNTPENVTFAGAAAVMFAQARVSKKLTIPAGTAIAATSLSQVVFGLPAALFGTTTIESLQWSITAVGFKWGGLTASHNCSVTFFVATVGGVPSVIVNFYNPGAGFNIADPVDVMVAGYLPGTI